MASMKFTRPRVTYADLERAPEDGRRYELYDGEVCVVPSPIPRHQIVVQRLWQALDAYAADHGGLALISPIDIVLSAYDVVQPDLVFFSASRCHLVQLDKPICHPPDLVVEVLSPSTAGTDRGRKMHMLARYGLPEYWIVDPVARVIENYLLIEGAYTLVQATAASEVAGSPRLADLTIDLAGVFP
jgi:Uma2 family endonuclease